ncbi:unnamed protein product [Cunninghamella echinulata]
MKAIITFITIIYYVAFIKAAVIYQNNNLPTENKIIGHTNNNPFDGGLSYLYEKREEREGEEIEKVPGEHRVAVD